MFAQGSAMGMRGWPQGLALKSGLIGAVLGGVLVGLFGLASASRLEAEPGVSRSSDSVIALTTEAPGQAGGTFLYLVDSRNQAFAVYRIDGLNGGTIQLEAARNYAADLKLTEYNNIAPKVSAIEAMVASPRSRGSSDR